MYSQKLVTIDTNPYDAAVEAYVDNDDHDHDATIHICGDGEYWAEFFKRYDCVEMMTAILSHEILHNVLLKVSNNQVSSDLDNLFGGRDGCGDYEDYHGLINLEKNFKPRKDRLRSWRWAVN